MSMEMWLKQIQRPAPPHTTTPGPWDAFVKWCFNGGGRGCGYPWDYEVFHAGYKAGAEEHLNLLSICRALVGRLEQYDLAPYFCHQVRQRLEELK